MVTFTYSTDVSAVREENLVEFFEGWAHRPPLASTLKVLRDSYRAVTAWDRDTGELAGFITCISDGHLSAYLPLLEVVPEYRGLGVGTELVKHMLGELRHLYMVDLCCDEDVAPFYERLGEFDRTVGMVRRNYEALKS